MGSTYLPAGTANDLPSADLHYCVLYGGTHIPPQSLLRVHMILYMYIQGIDTSEYIHTYIHT